VSHEALRDHASRVRFVGTDVDVFEAYRDLIERVASNAYDAGERFDDQGRVLVTSEALGRAWARGEHVADSRRWPIIRGQGPPETPWRSRRKYETRGASHPSSRFYPPNAQNQVSLSTTFAFVKPATISASVNPLFGCPE
jgi:hypothetical protein